MSEEGARPLGAQHWENWEKCAEEARRRTITARQRAATLNAYAFWASGSYLAAVAPFGDGVAGTIGLLVGAAACMLALWYTLEKGGRP